MSKTGITIALIILLMVGVGSYLVLTKTPPHSTGNTGQTAMADQSNSTNSTENQTASPSAGLQIEDIKVGSGPAVKSGDTVVINYTGTLLDGTKFDSSYDRGQPFTTQIGVGQVIKGWDEGVVGMKVGGKRKLTIPPDLAYGDQAVGSIPPNSTLVFEVELMGIK